jgi:4-alpha-glucanotransferase
VVRTVLGRLGVPADNDAEVRAALGAPDFAALPPTIVLRQGAGRELGVPAILYMEDGAELPVHGALPADLPLGWHLLVSAQQRVTVIVAPLRLPSPPQAWGWAVQLYAMHSPGSWGMGDFADLREFCAAAGAEHAADAVLVNPLHAITPTHPVEPSPYSPSSRRFVNPLYLRITETDAYREASGELRSKVDDLALAEPAGSDSIDYDAVWRAKCAALELLAPSLHTIDLDDDPALRDFGVFCALAEQYGGRWQQWPEELRHPSGAAVTAPVAAVVAAKASELDSRVRFHVWLQQLCEQQLAEAQHGAERSGMRVGVLTDLAVGIAPGGADSWALQDVLAPDVTIGAPPDAFNQRGQNWSLAPWHPRKLAEAGYRPFRDMLRAQLRHAGGLRIDHVAGLWRLWWIPEGEGPDRGTYVHYDAEALLAVLALEAHRAGAMIVGEDLGTVQDEVSETLREQNMLGCAVAWFERREPDADGAEPLLPPARWPEQAAATISTHDLPTAAGFLSGEHVRVRAELDQLGGDPADEWARAARERAELVALLHDEGLLASREPERDEIIAAMHALLARTPCRLLLASPYDVIGETRQPNLPGTVDQYPNWRLPLPWTIERLMADERVRRMIAPLQRARPRRTGRSPG